MCEPYHSISQFRDDDNDRLGCTLGPIAKLLKKLGGFWHLSKMGKGHSGALECVRNTSNHGAHVSFLVPEHNDYEVAWWNRHLKPDRSKPNQDALLAAKDYANLTSIGSLHALRQFLEMSIKLSDKPMMYLTMMRHMLNKKGLVQWDLARKKLKTRNPKSLSSFCIGFTRKRGLLVPEWSDDAHLWDRSS